MGTEACSLGMDLVRIACQYKMTEQMPVTRETQRPRLRTLNPEDTALLTATKGQEAEINRAHGCHGSTQSKHAENCQRMVAEHVRL